MNTNRVLGAVVSVLAVATIAVAVEDRNHDREARECLSDNFSELTAALTVRRDLTDATNDLRDRDRSQIRSRLNEIDAILAASARGVPSPGLTVRYLNGRREFRTEARELKGDIRKAKAEQTAIPIPDYPQGECEE